MMHDWATYRNKNAMLAQKGFPWGIIFMIGSLFLYRRFGNFWHCTFFQSSALHCRLRWNLYHIMKILLMVQICALRCSAEVKTDGTKWLKHFFLPGSNVANTFKKANPKLEVNLSLLMLKAPPWKPGIWVKSLAMMSKWKTHREGDRLLEDTICQNTHFICDTCLC